MAKREIYEAKTEALAAPIAEEKGLTVVDTEYVKEGSSYYLRVYIDKPGGVGINDCEAVSRALSDALDREDFIPDAYVLEVSSPGLGRAIKKDRDFERNLGKPVEVHLFKPAEKQKEWVGDLKAFDASAVTIETEGRTLTLERKNISLIREYVNWDEF